MNTRFATHAFALSALLLLCGADAVAQDKKTEDAAKALQKKAMEEDYLATEFPKAQEKLEKALAACGDAKCSPALRAKLHRDLGVVQVGGKLDEAKGKSHFAEAQKLDGSLQLDPDLKTAELQAAWDGAGKSGGAAGGSGDGGGSVEGDFLHVPVKRQQVRTPVPVYVEYSGEEKVVKTKVRYKGFGMSDWKSLDGVKMSNGWGVQIPCDDVQRGEVKYYVQGFDENNDPVATSGDRNTPFTVEITPDAVDDPPHLPGQPPGKQCAEKGDCPPDFPGCKNPPKASAKGEEPTGKDGGETCEEDSECKSGTCKDEKCTEPEGSVEKYARMWVGLSAGVDFAFIPSAEDVCKLNNADGFPLNTGNYYCTEGGSDYPARPTGDPQVDARLRAQNDAIQLGKSNKVDGGATMGAIRIMASFDYALNTNTLLGARAGVALGTYPGQAAKADGRAFSASPMHLEARATYVIGKDPLAKAGFAPFVFVGGGASSFDARVKVSVVETGNPQAREVDAWHVGGPWFFALGGGGRYAFSPKAALLGGLRANFAFGNSFQPSVGPELGVQVGF